MADLKLVKPGDEPPPGGGPPYDAAMEARVSALEAAIKHLATKEDLVRVEGVLRTELHKEIGAQTWKLVTFVCGFGTALVAATYFIAKLTH